jgi:hypothetical protein
MPPECCWAKSGWTGCPSRLSGFHQPDTRARWPQPRSCCVTLSNPADGDRPLDGRPPRICHVTAARRGISALLKKCQRATTQRNERSDITVRSRTRQCGCIGKLPGCGYICKPGSRRAENLSTLTTSNPVIVTFARCPSSGLVDTPVGKSQAANHDWRPTVGDPPCPRSNIHTGPRSGHQRPGLPPAYQRGITRP